MRYSMILVILLVLITGCSSETQQKVQDEVGVAYIDNPTVDEVLTKYQETDIFLMNGIVYVNAKEVDWVQELDLTMGEEVMEITSQSTKSKEFTEGTASLLPVGTKIYKTLQKGDFYIALVKGEEIRYLGWREG